MEQQQIKSRKRVADHGEVFTGEREVKAMCDLVADECRRIDSRFLEPACGDGNFLAEILSRKLDVVAKNKNPKREAFRWERDALLALSSLYGVEILPDNCQECRKRLFELWDARYKKAVKKAEQNDEVRESARYILSRNIICGDALSLHRVDDQGRPTEEPIIFSNWAFIKDGVLMKREDYTFEELLNQGEQTAKPRKEPEQLSLDLSDQDSQDGEGTLIQVYPPIHYRRLKDYG